MIIVKSKKVGIKIIEKFEDYKTFIFTGSIPSRYFRCEGCGKNRLEPAYIDIIERLKKAKLLSEDYKMLCCNCFYKMEKIGMTKCPHCNSNLAIRKHIEIVRIICINCWKVYYSSHFNEEDCYRDTGEQGVQDEQV